MLQRLSLITLFLASLGCAGDDDVNYSTETTDAPYCFEEDTVCPPGSGPCSADSDCPEGYYCSAQARCSDTPMEPCIDNDGDGHGDNCMLGDDCDDDAFFRNPSVRR